MTGYLVVLGRLSSRYISVYKNYFSIQFCTEKRDAHDIIICMVNMGTSPLDNH